MEFGATKEHRGDARRRGQLDLLVPAGVWHSVGNTEDEDLKLYSLYSPPSTDGTVHRTKKDARRPRRRVTEPARWAPLGASPGSPPTCQSACRPASVPGQRRLTGPGPGAPDHRTEGRAHHHDVVDAYPTTGEVWSRSMGNRGRRAAATGALDATRQPRSAASRPSRRTVSSRSRAASRGPLGRPVSEVRDQGSHARISEERSEGIGPSLALRSYHRYAGAMRAIHDAVAPRRRGAGGSTSRVATARRAGAGAEGPPRAAATRI